MTSRALERPVERRVLPAGPLPGLLLAGAGAAAALLGHALVPVLSPTLLAIALGALLGGTGLAGAPARPGLAVASRRVLRVGVALLGLQLVLPEVLRLGWPVLLVALGVVVLGIAGSLALARLLGVPPGQALLVACGFSICGAAAVAAVDGVRRHDEEDVGLAVSLVVVCGSVAMLAVPAAALLLGLDTAGAGAWAGASVHEVGQVVVAGGLLGGTALQVAVLVKLARVLLLAPVLTALAWRTRRASRRTPGAPAVEGQRRPPPVPGFVVVFIGLVVLRTAVPLPAPVLDAAALVQSVALAAAMFALGSGLSGAVLRSAGRRVLVLAGGATVLVGLLGLPAALVV